MIVSETADSTEYPALEAEADIPVITSEGKSNVKIAGVKSKNKLVRYTIPETLLRADENFLALMVEAEKYIGYPYGATCSQLKRLGTCPMIGGEKKDG